MTLLQESHSIKKTPLYDRHVSLNAKIIDFHGWMLPVYYSGIIAEHQWVRKSCGIFDVSHLGEIRVKGAGAEKFLQYRLTNDMRKLSDGRMLYNLLCDEQGYTLDDILIYRVNESDFYLIVNAANIERDLEALKFYAPDGLSIEDQSERTACVAIQGPESEKTVQTLFGFDTPSMAYYSFREAEFKGQPVWISRSGYTGEDGFEIFSSNEVAPLIWDRLIEGGASKGILPAGLGARNTLRLEAGNGLFGNEMNATTTPLEAGLPWVVSFDKEGGFVGRDMLMVQREKGLRRKLVGFKVLDKPVARDKYTILKDGKKIGQVTSGSYAPTVGANIGMGYVQTGQEAPGNRIEIEIHGKPVPAEVVKTPFVPLNHKKKERR